MIVVCIIVSGIGVFYEIYKIIKEKIKDKRIVSDNSNISYMN